MKFCVESTLNDRGLQRKDNCEDGEVEVFWI